MVFTSTSTANVRHAHGFTLPEFLVAMAIGVMALGAACLLWANATKTCAMFLNYMEMSSASKNALDRISQNVRNARTIQSCSSNQLVMLDSTNQQVSLTYDSNTQTLTETRGTEQRTLLTGCNSFEFSMFQRTPKAGTYDLYTTATTNLLKVVQMKWTCSRKVTGDQQNAESQVSSKVVLRNQ